jgi:hypothetical protein
MTGRKLWIMVICVMAVILAGGAINTVYACPQNDVYCRPLPSTCKDLKIRDQDETWADGVHGTWTAGNMKPGDEFDFDGHFVGLRGNLPNISISCDYIVLEESPIIEADTDPATGLHPDTMAKYMVITRCTYRGVFWWIDCLTGKSGGIWGNKTEWRIDDIDHDGRLTFYDLKNDPLVNLPSPQTVNNNGIRFEMSIRFDQNAGNEFQGDTFNLAMIYRAGGPPFPWKYP